MLHADVAPAGADRLVERIVVGDGAELLAVARPEALDGRIVEQYLVHRLEDDALDGAGAALRQRVEAAQALERIAEKVQAQRRGRAGREEIEDAAAHGEFSRLAHGVGAAITVAIEEADEPVERDAPAAPELEHAVAEERARRHALQRGVDRGQHDAAHARRRRPGEAGQRVDAAAHDLGVRRDTVVRQAVPGRQRDHLEPRLEKGERRGCARHAPVVAADMQQRAQGAHGELAQHEGVMAFGRAGDGDAPGRCRLIGREEGVEAGHAGRGR